MSSSSDIRFTKLKGRENYDTWKLSAKSYLIIKGSWKCIVNGLAGDANETAKEEDASAWSQLLLLLEEGVYSYMASTVTSKDAWTALENAFEDKGLCRKVELLKQMVQLKLIDCVSMEEYVNKMVMTSLKVQKAGLKFDEEIIASFLLAGLPEEYSPLVMAVENSATALTIDSVKTTLLQDTRFDSNNNNGDGSGAFMARSKFRRTNTYRCHNCGEKGHFARSCRNGYTDVRSTDDSEAL